MIASCVRKEMLLLACGSRSMSSVLRPRIASAAARLTAVVVLPTPPFWFAIATIIRCGPGYLVEVGRDHSRDWGRGCQIVHVGRPTLESLQGTRSKLQG